MKFEIEFVKNGIVVAQEGEKYVAYRGEDEFKNWVYFLNELTDDWGPVGSRHNDEQIYISVYPGDKSEKWGKEECPVCGCIPDKYLKGVWLEGHDPGDENWS